LFAHHLFIVCLNVSRCWRNFCLAAKQLLSNQLEELHHDQNNVLKFSVAACEFVYSAFYARCQFEELLHDRVVHAPTG
jgi:hypothetical protein